MPQTATRLPADRRRRLRRIVIFLVTALSLIGVSVTAASVGAGSSAVARWRAPDNRLPASSPSDDARESLDFVQHSTLVPEPMPTPAPVLELTAAIIPIAPAGPGGSGSPGAGGSVSVSAGGVAAAGSGIVVSSVGASRPAHERCGVGCAEASGRRVRRVTEPGGSESGHECPDPGQGPGLCPHRDPRVSSRGDLGAALGDGHRSRWRDAGPRPRAGGVCDRGGPHRAASRGPGTGRHVSSAGSPRSWIGA